jgi:putative transposase
LRSIEPGRKRGGRERPPHEPHFVAVRTIGLSPAGGFSFIGSASLPTSHPQNNERTANQYGSQGRLPYENRISSNPGPQGSPFRRVGVPADREPVMDRRRTNIRLPKEVYEIQSQIFSITICTHDRHPLFQNDTRAKIVLDSIGEGLADQTEQYAWCLMPDHLHLLVAPRQRNLADVLNAWKSYAANRLRREGLDGPCWQRGFCDHALRKEEEIRKVADYIVNNPVRKGLVQNWQDYPFCWHRWM